MDTGRFQRSETRPAQADRAPAGRGADQAVPQATIAFPPLQHPPLKEEFSGKLKPI
jgi:hypothetical protein